MAQEEAMEPIVAIIVLLALLAVIVLLIVSVGMSTSLFGTARWVQDVAIVLTTVLCAFRLVC